ncbi:hypothetical protein [Natrinema gari]|uniref:Uncharacterized protein n=1 Tax=Natrinema gari JCM 14663 TaxID=1230459 RepID=L9YX54_9EURY|nr:hypothetical protein [Natrinema gari]ELY78042.1 hypothetical protein C486_14282 [Natrinema gari JCM 14663]
MSPPDDRLPTTVTRGLVLAALVGALALAVSQPIVAAGVPIGLGLAVAIRAVGGSDRRVALGAALLPIAVLAGVATVGLTGTPVAGLSAVIGMALATAVCGVVVGQPTAAALMRTGGAALCASVLAGGSALVAIGIDTAGGTQAALIAALWLTGDGVFGLLVALVVAAVAVVAALLVVPPAAVTVPSRDDSYAASRNALAKLIGVATAIAIGGLSILTVGSVFVPALEPVVEALTGSAAVRGLLAAVTGAALLGVAVSVVIRSVWRQTDGRRNAVVAIVAGSMPGVGLPFAAVIGVGGIEAMTVATLFGAAAAALGVGWLAAWLYEGVVGRNEATNPETAVAAALAAGGVVSGASVDTATLGLETGRTGVATVVPIAAALFAYDVGRYGRTLAREIGSEASRRPQLVRLGWSGGVAAVGVLVGALGMAGATVLAPTLSVPATAGVIVAVAAVVGGTWVLVR